jgi:hypothetical protein
MLHACIKPVKAIKSPPLFFLFYFFPSFEGDERIFKSLFGIIMVSLIFQSIFYLKKLFKTKKFQKISIPFLNPHPIVINESFIALPCSLTLFPALRLT